MSESEFHDLEPREQALVAFGVLIDGPLAVQVFEKDEVFGNRLQVAARELSGPEPELRLPLAGTLLRIAAAELSRK